MNMKKILAIAAALALLACAREPALHRQGKAIVFAASEPHYSLETKTAETTGLSSFRVVATRGSSGSEVNCWSNVLFSRSGDVYYGGQLWPVDDPSYHFYAANVTLTPGATGARLTAANTTDVVCAYLPHPDYEQTNVLHFKHIFARIGGVKLLAETGYTVTDIQVRLQPRTGGVYDIAAGAGHTDETGWSQLVTGTDTVIGSALGENACNIYLVPGIYTARVSWTWQKTGGAATAASRQTLLDLEAGKSSRLTFLLGEEMVYGVDL